MSIRHQIEILYSDYLDQIVDGIKLLKEIDDKKPVNIGEYNFRDIIEGFTSYLLRDYLPFDKPDILENVKGLEQLSKEDQHLDIFKKFLQCFHNFLTKINELSQGWEYKEENMDIKLSGAPYGKNAQSIFGKAQSMTALGAAIGFLKDRELIGGFETILDDVKKIHFKGEVTIPYNNILRKLDEIRNTSTKIGNAQRAYFYYFFRELFNNVGDSYLIIDDAIENAFTRYRQNA
jgi:hypothetical protein